MSASYELPFGKGKRWMATSRAGRKARQRLAGERDRDVAERLPVHAAGRLEPLRRRQYEKSGSAFSESIVHRTGRAGDADPMVQSERLRPAGRGHLWESGPRSLYRTGLGRRGPVRVQEHAVSEGIALQFRAEFFNLLNRTNLGTPNATVFSGTAVSPSAGLITTLATTPRQIQFGLKLIF